MKRILVFGVLLISATCAFAQAVSLGALASFSPVVFDDQTVLVSGTSMSLDYSFSNIGVRVFADFTYGEVSLGFAAPVTQLTMKVSAIPTTVPFSLSLFDVRLVGKYPFHFGSFTVFPLAGLDKYFCLSGSANNVSYTSQDLSDLSPWLLLIGVGGDLKIGEKLYARAELTGSYNITSERSASYYTGTTYQSSYGYEIQMAVGVGFSL